MKRLFATLLIAVYVGLASGCAGMPKGWPKAMPWADKAPSISESKYQAPVKMVALWSPAMYTPAGQKPTRGFGGRLYFYNAKNETIPVQGQLVVYCYNDSNKSTDHKQADRRVAFTPEQFSGHFSPTELGASYSVWVPWDAVGNPQAEISLVPIFTAASGQVVVGSQSLGLLPGPETPIPEKSVEEKIYNAKVTQDGDVTRVGYDENLPDGTIRQQSRINTFSVTLPENLAQRVAANRNQEPGLLREPETRLKLLPRVPNPQLPPGTTAGTSASSAKESSLEPKASPMLIAPAPLTHSGRFQPKAPALQLPPPIGGLAPSQPPPSGQQSNHP